MASLRSLLPLLFLVLCFAATMAEQFRRCTDDEAIRCSLNKKDPQVRHGVVLALPLVIVKVDGSIPAEKLDLWSW